MKFRKGDILRAIHDDWGIDHCLVKEGTTGGYKVKWLDGIDHPRVENTDGEWLERYYTLVESSRVRNIMEKYDGTR